MGDRSALEAVLKQDRRLVIGALALVIAVSWIYILAGAGMGMSAFEMTRRSGGALLGSDAGVAELSVSAMQMTGMAMMQPMVWTPGYAVVMFFMWWIMMLAMMLPSASPMILLHAAVARKTQQRRGTADDGTSPLKLASHFILGYLVIWAGFSVLATAGQWGLEASGLLSSMMVTTSAALGGGLLIAAGLYQLTPLKQAIR